MAGPKLILLAFDGMDYLYAKLYGLRLAGRVYRLRSRADVPTPQLWALVISGEWPRTRQFVVNPVPRALRRIARLVLPKRIRRAAARRVVKWPTREYLSRPSIFDRYKSLVVDFPLYNWELPAFWRRHSLQECIGNLELSEYVMSEVVRRDRGKWIRFLKALEGGDKYDVAAVWFQSIDIANHLFPLNDVLRRSLYMWASCVTQTVMTVSPLSTVVVLSDHGGRKGVHSCDAVISCSRQVPLPRRIEEVHEWLLRILSGDWRDSSYSWTPS